MELPPLAFERRDVLRAAGALGIGSLLGSALHAAPSSPLPPIWQAGTCTLTPSSITGPFWKNLALLRRDITEGHAGVPLDIFLKVVSGATCAPILGAVVDLWHVSPSGRYSGFASQGTAGQTFLRGIQITPANGIAHFRTVFPGWYAGRATHLHVKINPTQTTELTTQLYFDPAVTSSVYGLQPYRPRGQNPTTNATDSFFLPQTVLPARELKLAGMLLPFPGARRVVTGMTIVID